MLPRGYISSKLLSKIGGLLVTPVIGGQKACPEASHAVAPFPHVQSVIALPSVCVCKYGSIWSGSGCLLQHKKFTVNAAWLCPQLSDAEALLTQVDDTYNDARQWVSLLVCMEESLVAPQ